MSLFSKTKSHQESRDTKDTKTENSPILLIDGSVLCYMALNAMGHLSYNGKNTGVTYGVLQKILSLSNKFKTNKYIFCWDSKGSNREKIYAKYKSKRIKNRKEKTIEEREAHQSLIRQREGLMNYVLPELGFKNNFICSGYEGDDILAWWVLRLNERKVKARVVMVTTDADMYQELDYCDIWNPQKKKFFTKRNLLIDFGVLPNQWAMAKAIGGCDGDGVVGIRGASDPKKAASKALKYIIGKLVKGKIYDKIESKEGQEIIKRNLKLVSLPFDNEIKRMVLRRNRFTRQKFLRVFDQHHFKSFLDNDNFIKWEKAFLR